MMPPAMNDDWNQAQLLKDAKANAERLIRDLVAQQQDLDRFAGQIAPDKLEPGQRPFADAIRSARATLHGLDDAIQITR